MNIVRVKSGVEFTTIAPGGFRLLGAIDLAARVIGVDVTITSACDGAHSGPEDPHHRGEAYDVRTKGIPEPLKDALLTAIMAGVRTDDEPPAQPVFGTPRSLATNRFFGFVEAPGTDNEHLHVQVRKGRTYP